LFYGDEEYMKQFCLAATREALIKSNDAFNHIKLSAENYSLPTLTSSIESVPMFADKKFIEIHSLDIADMKDSEFEEFTAVIGELPDYDYNVLILYMTADSFDAGSAKYPSKLLTELSKLLVPVNFEFETPPKLIKWIQQHFKAGGIVIEPEVCLELINNVGQSMYRLKSEIEKLCAYLLSDGRNNVSSEDVADITIHVKAIDPFDFANAVLDGNMDKAFYILSDMKERKEKPEIILSQVSRVYDDLCLVKSLYESGMSSQTIASKLKMHEYKTSLYLKSASKRSLKSLRHAVDLCFDADIKIKSTALDNYTVLDRLVIELAYTS
jgi:DNA polymerase III, delta subunit